MEDIMIRQMSADDIPEVSRVQSASFEWGAERSGYSAEQIEAYFAQRGSPDAIRIQYQESHCLVACLGARIVGVVGIRENEVTKLYVDPEYLRKGIGTTLFKAAEAIIALAGYPDLLLYTIFDYTIPFYQALDLRVSERRIVAYGPMRGAKSIVLTKKIGRRND